MTEEEVIEKLSEGWELANRGVGWWLSQPHIAYRRSKSFPIDDSVIKSLETAKRIKLELPYTTLWARLVEPGPPAINGEEQ